MAMIDLVSNLDYRIKLSNPEASVVSSELSCISSRVRALFTDYVTLSIYLHTSLIWYVQN